MFHDCSVSNQSLGTLRGIGNDICGPPGKAKHPSGRTTCESVDRPAVFAAPLSGGWIDLLWGAEGGRRMAVLVSPIGTPYSLSACLAEGQTGVFDRVEAVGD